MSNSHINKLKNGVIKGEKNNITFNPHFQHNNM